MREFCVKYVPEQCEPEFRTQYENYFIGRLESPCFYCEDVYVNREDESCFNLEETWLTISNPKDGKMLGIDYEGKHYTDFSFIFSSLAVLKVINVDM